MGLLFWSSLLRIPCAFFNWWAWFSLSLGFFCVILLEILSMLLFCLSSSTIQRLYLLIMLQIYCSVWSLLSTPVPLPSSVSEFLFLYSISKAFHWGFYLACWVFISSVISVWIFFSNPISISMFWTNILILVMISKSIVISPLHCLNILLIILLNYLVDPQSHFY